MGKRSNFERRPRDFYPTPAQGVAPLLWYLSPSTLFCEPCAGDGALIRTLEDAGHICKEAWDIEPRGEGIGQRDALLAPPTEAHVYITNPPWSRDVLHPLIARLSDHRPTWLLFDADWMHTAQAAPLLPRCALILSVGRLKWIPGSKYTGKDNCAWYCFNHWHKTGPSFVGRNAHAA